MGGERGVGEDDMQDKQELFMSTRGSGLHVPRKRGQNVPHVHRHSSRAEPASVATLTQEGLSGLGVGQRCSWTQGRVIPALRAHFSRRLDFLFWRQWRTLGQGETQSDLWLGDGLGVSKGGTWRYAGPMCDSSDDLE